MNLNLYDFSGEFCSRRTTPGLQNLKKKLHQLLTTNTSVLLSTAKVKIITPSYVDELLPSLMIEFGKDKVLTLIKFDPPLAGYAAEQIERGYNNRNK